MSLPARAWLALAARVMVMGLLLFVSAGTLRFGHAWAYLGIFAAASALITLQLVRGDRPLLERRMRGGAAAERRPAQRLIAALTSVGFAALLIVPALGRRFEGSGVPLGAVVAGDALVALGLYFVSRVYRENTFTSATVEVAENQRVISTGPYSIVRHPMYASAALYLLGTSLALGSYWGLVPFLALLSLLVWRLVDEEQLLARSLPGYVEYQGRVRRRLVPFVW